MIGSGVRKAHPSRRLNFASLICRRKKLFVSTIQCEFRFCAVKRDSLKKVLEKGDRVRERGKEPFSKGFSLFPGISPYWEQSIKKKRAAAYLFEGFATAPLYCIFVRCGTAKYLKNTNYFPAFPPQQPEGTALRSTRSNPVIVPGNPVTIQETLRNRK